MIEAAPGGGKTRLVEEVMARAALDGGVCIATRAVPADHHQDMSGIVALARGGLLDAPGVAATSPAALAAIAREASGLGAAVIEALKAVSAEQPVLLALDDAQWLDDASLGALETMLRDLAKAPVLILLAAPPEPTTPKLAEVRAAIGRDAPGSLVRLPVFDAATLQALVSWAFPQYTTDEVTRLSRRIVADSAGIPLLAVEICQAIAQGLDVRATNGAWPKPFKTLDQTLPGDLPDTIVAAIRVGFNTLSPTAAAALKAAAVIGERVPAERIGRAARLVGSALDAALDELEWRRWVVADPRGYSFVARIVREVVERDMVTEGERQRLLNA